MALTVHARYAGKMNSRNVNMVKTKGLNDFGFTSVAIPKAENSSKGVSVEYVPEAGKEWFVLRATYQREDRAADALIEAGHYAYVAKRYVVKEVNGRRKRTLENLIPSILFAYITADFADLIIRDNRKDEKSPCPTLATFLGYYYNHFEKNEFDKNPPLRIREGEMLNFILATCKHSEDLISLSRGKERLVSGDEVIVTRGPFKGVQGKVLDDDGRSRIVVSLTGLGNYATTRIPYSYLRQKPLVVDCSRDE